MADESFLANVPVEGQDPAEEKETPPAPPAEEKKPEEKSETAPPPQEGGDKPEEKAPQEPETPEGTPDDKTETPFHEHPRFQELVKDRNTARTARDEMQTELERMRSDYDEKLQDLTSKQSQATPPMEPWFKEQYGDDKDAWREYHNRVTTERQKLIDEAVDRVRQDQVKAQQTKDTEAKKWDKWVGSQIQMLKDEGQTFDENELMNTTLKFLPSDAAGNIDFRKGLEILNAMKTREGEVKSEKVQARKELAGKAAPKSAPETKAPDYQTSDSLKNKSFGDLAHGN